MPLGWLLTAALCLVQLTAPVARADPGEAREPGYLRMRKVAMVDEHGFERPMPAFTLLIPSDWKFEGQVQWARGQACRMYGFRMHLTGPDGRSLDLFPDYGWAWADDPMMRQSQQASARQAAQFGGRACDQMAPLSAADFLRRVAVRQLLPGHELVSVEPLPGYTQQVQAAARQQQAQAAQVGLRLKVVADAARARLAGLVDGKPVEEWLMAVVQTTGTLGPSFSMGRPGQAFTYQSEARMLYLLRAPRGRLDGSQRLLDAVLGSVQFDPRWQARIQGAASNIAAINAKGAADRAKIASDTNREIAAIRQSGNDYRAQVQDQSNRKSSQYLRDVESYQDPGTGEKVELSNRYGHAWVNGSGEYLLSDNPSFDPSTVAPDKSWKQMQHVEP